MNNYPDGLSESTPGAPWNEPDAAPLICSVCMDPTPDGVEEGSPCLNVEPMFDPNTGEHVPPCDGTYVVNDTEENRP